MFIYILFVEMSYISRPVFNVDFSNPEASNPCIVS